MSQDQTELVYGGGFWGSVLGTVGGVATIVGGVACLCVPEPTCSTKVAGVAAIVAGACWIGSCWC